MTPPAVQGAQGALRRAGTVSQRSPGASHSYESLRLTSFGGAACLRLQRRDAWPVSGGAPPQAMPEAIPLDIVYEDEHLMVINKARQAL